MARSVKAKPKERRRPATDRQPFVGVRLPRSLISEIEKWAAAQGASISRSEAIRRLVELALAGLRPIPRRSAKAAAKASDLAAEQIDKLADASATSEERQQRKRSLLKGPREFRDVREDASKPKR